MRGSSTRLHRIAILITAVLMACAPPPAQRGAVPVPAQPGEDPTAHVPDPTTRVWPVMGTLLEVTVWEADPARARRALRAARTAVVRVDSLMSLYKPESELSRVNRSAGGARRLAVSVETAEVLAASLRYAEETGGSLDVTVAPVVDVWGFYRHEGRMPPAAVLDSARALVGYRAVEFDPDRRTVRLPRRGMRLDFGAIAKGYAVDRAVAALRAADIARGMVDLGGNLRVFGPAPGREGWAVGLRDPRNPEDVFAVVVLDSGAVATSGDYEQFFWHDGVRYSHIIDPRTGWPARGVASTSVVAPTALAADALSTALFVLGPEEGCRRVRRFRGAEAVWVRDPVAVGDTAGTVLRAGHVVATPGLASRTELLLPSSAPGGEDDARRPAPCRPVGRAATGTPIFRSASG